ncbi:MAG: hypothetical protein V9E82_10720 [Candidatus Nanopelagicales bacterium]
MSVKDATGAVIGQSLNSVSTWLSGSALVYTDGGAYTYNLGSGKVVSEDWDSVAYLDGSCSPTNAAVPVYNTARYLAALTSFGRMVDRPNTDLPTRAFKGTTTVRAVLPGETFWFHDAPGRAQGTHMWNDTHRDADTRGRPTGPSWPAEFRLTTSPLGRELPSAQRWTQLTVTRTLVRLPLDTT